MIIKGMLPLLILAITSSFSANARDGGEKVYPADGFIEISTSSRYYKVNNGVSELKILNM